ncbi:unnamed protein product [Ectocarpus sp. 8 AP-2014]
MKNVFTKRRVEYCCSGIRRLSSGRFLTWVQSDYLETNDSLVAPAPRFSSRFFCNMVVGQQGCHLPTPRVTEVFPTTFGILLATIYPISLEFCQRRGFDCLFCRLGEKRGGILRSTSRLC